MSDIQEDIRGLTAAILALTERSAQAGKARMDILSNTRMPSMAAVIGQGATWQSPDPSRSLVGIHPYLKGSLPSGYQAGDFITALSQARSSDAEEQTAGKARLQMFGLAHHDIPDGSINKATLGTTGATGGYVLPNNFVEGVIKPEVGQAIFTNGPDALLTVRSGVNVRGVDLPYRTGSPSRMTFQNWGATKDNVDEAYGSYTATLGTMARIYDIGKQYLRFSAGSAEQDVIDELVKGRDLGETYYTLAGAGTGTVGSGDPTVGIYTALAAVFGAYTTVFSGATANTIAKSAATAISVALSALSGRSRRATAVVMDAVTYWTILSQGSDTAGFWLSPVNSGGFTINPNGGLALWGVPILWHPNFNEYTGTTKAAIAADWKAFRFYRGAEFRVDSSDLAGERWDKNLVGYRGEQEVGFSAYPGVFTGAAQLITGIIP